MPSLRAALDAATKRARCVPTSCPTAPARSNLPTDLTVERVQESFASPDTLSVWELPGFISLLERSGFSSVRHRLHFQALLALPLLAATMALVAAGFSMRPARRGGVARMIAGGVAAGFALFLISKLAESFGQSGALPVMLAAWAPGAAGLMLAWRCCCTWKTAEDGAPYPPSRRVAGAWRGASGDAGGAGATHVAGRFAADQPHRPGDLQRRSGRVRARASRW